MEPTNNGTNMPIRMSYKQVKSLLDAMTNTKAAEVEITRGEDGRLIVKQVQTVEKLRALKIS